MGRKFTRLAAVTAIAATAAFGLAACGDDDDGGNGAAGGSGGGTGKIGVILPDTKSSDRWATADQPLLEAAFKAAGVEYDIQNAQGDATQMQTIADQMITSGVTVLLITNLDSGSGKAIQDKAKAQGVATIDYDRLTLGGSAQYYVSFDNVAVGRLQGEGLVKCLEASGAQKPIVAELNGAPTDNNASLFKEGYDSVLDPKYADGTFVKGPDQSVPKWDNQEAGTIFEQMLTQEPNIGGVLAANDGLGGAAIAILAKNGLNGKVPVTGQDATTSALQNILAGDQCMTVYKAVQKEAEAAAKLAIALAKGEPAEAPDKVNDPEGKRDVPSVLLEPVAITKDNVKDVIDDGYVTRAEVCTGKYEALCASAGI
ncbi:substrate-binding domain-containing protein [Frankia sp. CNm7]|uniref:Substrate-binding domain-containing protein n=1 Tax=Frankia nepalensis TaxID=1836974 RepID=A0A937RJS4_9ACTN|nr:substrate-binding domain-containing protein [Frankia nepalensis]MBL7500318.1 substrate-binding domain-containing protein [Frankia nepalensis]MBL7508540.1 substrate-binding domain-containing protein [Frankia nepalensis]MBL7520419.1 substrate-binding domain-containing protein [Frankia nepalensis]MBL7627668.1 substrate-binding domain-containing protein [Frankia nepalensis]